MNKVIELMENFFKAYEELNEYWSADTTGETDIMNNDDYPFELSFDEYYLKISEWIESAKEKLGK